ncbi:MAG TPA: BrnT family toxin [Promineifilum sp.]
MKYEWDKAKAASNRRKHGVRFADAVTVLEDGNAVTIEDEHPNEERFVTLGLDARERLLVVVYTFRDDTIRIISARKATSTEQRYYKGEP